jgi:hypothetical protein
MNSEDALIAFLNFALVKNKRERYVGFLSSNKGRNKFLKALYHDLANCIDEQKTVPKLTDDDKKTRGYYYSANGEFGDARV